jgi:hypothetical protein
MVHELGHGHSIIGGICQAFQPDFSSERQWTVNFVALLNDGKCKTIKPPRSKGIGMGVTEIGDQKKCSVCGGMNPAGAVKCLLCGSLMM